MQQIAPDRTDAVSRLAELHGRPYLCLRFPRGGAKEHRRFAQSRCVPGCSAAVHPSKRHPVDLAGRRLSPYRSRASPRRKLPGIRELHTIIRYRAQSQADHNSFTASELSSKPVATDPAAIGLSRTKLGGTTAIISRFAGDRHPNLSFRQGQHSMEQANHALEPPRVGPVMRGGRTGQSCY